MTASPAHPSATPSPSDSLCAEVDPFIGVDGQGNCLCGPYLPFSLVRLGPDSLPLHPTNGYRTRAAIARFSHTHVSGTGGGGRYGNIGVFPFRGVLRNLLDASAKSGEKAEPGYYRVHLEDQRVSAELTSTPRVGLHRYTYHEGEEANFLLDLGWIVQAKAGGAGENQAISTGGFLEMVSDREVVGRGDYKGGWGHSHPYSVYFCLRFDRPIRKIALWNAVGRMAGKAVDGPKCQAAFGFGKPPFADPASGSEPSSAGPASSLSASLAGPAAAGSVSPAGGILQVTVGISYLSLAQARKNIEREVGGRDFDAVRAEAASTWERELSRLRVTGGTKDERKLFYSLLTRLLCMPSDLGVDEEFPLWHSGVRHFTDLYCLWDSVRNANSLFTVIRPDFARDLLRCLLDIHEHAGWLPDAWIAGHSATIQGGSSADILFCEAAEKGLPGIDYAKALAAMRKNNETDSPDPQYQGRYLREYLEKGYLSTAVPKGSVSRTLEYAYQDYCIGRLAGRLGDRETAQRNYALSRNCWNLWREDIRFFAPKTPAGAFVEPFDPAHHLRDSWNDPYFYEGNSWQWSFNVQHDFAGLIARHGGPEAFIRHLDRFMETQFSPKETMLHVPFLYHYAGRPDLSSRRAREALARFYRPAPDGLPDNEDMGCQSAFYLCSAMGLYPMMGQDLYLLTLPLFERVELEVGPGRTFTIEVLPHAAKAAGTADIADASRAEASSQRAIRAATLNGQPLERAYLRHAEIMAGGILRLQVGEGPSEWGGRELPPSPLSGHQLSLNPEAK